MRKFGLKTCWQAGTWKWIFFFFLSLFLSPQECWPCVSLEFRLCLCSPRRLFFHAVARRGSSSEITSRCPKCHHLRSSGDLDESLKLFCNWVSSTDIGNNSLYLGIK